MNKCFFVGNLTRDPELATVGKDIKKCVFTIAVNRLKNKDGESKTDFIGIETWRAQAENCARYLKKGSKVAVLGELNIDEYEDKDGNKKRKHYINAREVEFLTSPHNTQEEEQKPVQKKKDPLEELSQEELDNLPF